MAGLDDALARIANDPAWADAVRTNPTDALRGFDLGPDELARLEHALGTHPGPPAAIFQAPPAVPTPAAAPPAAPPAVATPAAAPPAASAAAAVGGPTPVAGGIGAGKFPLVLAGLALAGGAVGVGVGASGALGSATGATLRADAATVYGCSDDTTRGPAVATLHRGDRVWVIGRSGTSWLVIRHPEQLTAPAWISAASLVNSGDPTKLPELTCSTALTLAAIVPTAATTPAATATGVTTATPTGTAVPTAPTSTSPTTSSSSTSKSSTSSLSSTSPTSSSSSSSSSTTSTPPPDTTGPTLTLTTDSGFLYSEGGVTCTAYKQQVTAAVTASDPSGATIDAVTWKAGTLSGSATKVATGSYRIGPVYSNHSGTIPMTITVTAHDGKGNTSTKSTTVDFRQIAETCIG